MLDQLIENLKNSGYRITSGRKLLLELLINQQQPLSAREILNQLKQLDPHASRATVYRELDFLQQQGIVREVLLGDHVGKYELTPEGCQHHLVCRNCGTTETIELGEELHNLEHKLAAQTTFKLDGHQVEFYGTCANCQ